MFVADNLVTNKHDSPTNTWMRTTKKDLKMLEISKKAQELAAI